MSYAYMLAKHYKIQSSKYASHIFLKKYSIYTDIHTRMSTDLYQYTHTHPTPISTSERLGRPA
jgi:hypothetical protein